MFIDEIILSSDIFILIFIFVDKEDHEISITTGNYFQKIRKHNKSAMCRVDYDYVNCYMILNLYVLGIEISVWFAPRVRDHDEAITSLKTEVRQAIKDARTLQQETRRLRQDHRKYLVRQLDACRAFEKQIKADLKAIDNDKKKNKNREA
ncbi:hypothetical protein Avbf_13550 [Armadillidium vulgare]|nr:hypothetical protein Avbf_13550 [Armadillidium vulgare]